MGTETQSGAEALLKELENKKLKELNTIEEEFRRKIAELEEQKEKEIRSIRLRAESEAASKSDSEANRIIGAAKLEAKRLIFDATEKMMSSNIQKLQTLLERYVRTDEYRQLLLKMAKYASKRLGKGILIASRAEDKQILSSMGFKTIDNDLKCIGGIKAFDSARSLELDLTFEELLRMKEEKLRSAIWEKVG